MKQDLEEMHAQGIDYIHFDMMDGHFVPRLGSGTYFLKQLTQRQPIPVEVHLMVEDPIAFVDDIVAAGVSMITFHIETNKDAYHIISKIRSTGVKAGIALRPFTALSSIEPMIDDIDSVLLMAFSPGVLNQPTMQGFDDRIIECRKMLDKRGRQDVEISVDGGINLTNIQHLRKAGVSIFVMGNSGLFLNSVTLTEQIAKIRNALEGQTT